MNYSVQLYSTVNAELSKDTIILPSEVYNMCVENKDKYIIMAHPVISYFRMKKLSCLNLLELSSLKPFTCILSSNIAQDIGLDADDCIHLSKIPDNIPKEIC
jgi:hypothetical protein